MTKFQFFPKQKLDGPYNEGLCNTGNQHVRGVWAMFSLHVDISQISL